MNGKSRAIKAENIVILISTPTNSQRFKEQLPRITASLTGTY
jgi:hypothetical protein